VFAEFEHATIVDRITAGIERRAKEGRWYSGRPPFGYTLSDGQLMPDPITAPIVRRIYKLYTEDRLGTIAIAHQLRAEHAPAPTAGWGHPAVHRVLTNPTYLGRIRWRNQDFASEHEPLIDPDTFQQAQTILAERGTDASRRRGNRSDFLLSGVIRCGHCGRAYIGMSAHGKGGTYHYYACTARQKYGPKACQGERVSREKLETAVLRQLTGIYRDGPLIHDALAAAQQQTQRERPALDERRHAIATEIVSIERSTERYFEAFEQGRLSPERCEQRVTHLNARLEDLQAQQAELADNGTGEAAYAPTPADLAATADQLEGVIAQGEPEQTKALLRILIAELRVNSKTDIQPTYRIITPDRTHTAGVCATSEKVETVGIEPTQRFRREED
jgi:site-specific DNA recombinase